MPFNRRSLVLIEPLVFWQGFLSELLLHKHQAASDHLDILSQSMIKEKSRLDCWVAEQRTELAALRAKLSETAACNKRLSEENKSVVERLGIIEMLLHSRETQATAGGDYECLLGNKMKPEDALVKSISADTTAKMALESTEVCRAQVMAVDQQVRPSSLHDFCIVS